jgi:hypothetical protein
MKAGFLVSITATVFALGLAQLAEAQTPGPVGVTVTVECTSSPERTMITNNTSIQMRVITLRSLFGDPVAGEPITVDTALAPSQTLTMTTGSGGTHLGNEIYDDQQLALEGARITVEIQHPVQRTTAEFDVGCTIGSRSFPLGAGPTPPQTGDGGLLAFEQEASVPYVGMMVAAILVLAGTLGAYRMKKRREQ